jgi:hypothetical protein
MELAICFSKYAMFHFDDFINGFAKHGKLTKAEATVVPSHSFKYCLLFRSSHCRRRQYFEHFKPHPELLETSELGQAERDAISGRMIEEMGL